MAQAQGNSKGKNCQYVGVIRRGILRKCSSADRECTEDWFGFDKYKKLIYGVHVSYYEGNRCEILMESIFGGEGKIIHRFDLDHNGGKLFGAVSTCGDFICLIHLSLRKGVNNSVYLFNISNGVFDKFNLIISAKFLQDDNDYHLTFSDSDSNGFLHVDSVGYVLGLHYECEKKLEYMLKFYYLFFNNKNKCCEFKLLTELFLYYSKPMSCAVITNKQIFVFKTYAPDLHVYDIEKDKWSKERCPLLRHIRGNPNPFLLAVSEDGRRKFTVTDKVTMYCIQELINDGLTLKCSNLNFPAYPYGVVTNFMATNDLIFAYVEWKNEGMFMNFNVPSLQDIAMKRIRSCLEPNVFRFSNALDALKLPTFMKRKYVGTQYCREYTS